MKNYKVLVIDDSPFIFKAVKKALEGNGFQVEDAAPNGKVGVELYEKCCPDLVTLDVTMPIMDGIETAKALFQKNPSVKIIMLSAMGDEVLMEEAKRIGISNFVTKPFKPEELQSVAKKLVGN